MRKKGRPRFKLEDLVDQLYDGDDIGALVKGGMIGLMVDGRKRVELYFRAEDAQVLVEKSALLKDVLCAEIKCASQEELAVIRRALLSAVKEIDEVLAKGAA